MKQIHKSDIDRLFIEMPNMLKLPLDLGNEWQLIVRENKTTMDKIIWVNENIFELTFGEYAVFMHYLILYRCIEQKVMDIHINEIEKEVIFLYYEVMESYLKRNEK